MLLTSTCTLFLHLNSRKLVDHNLHSNQPGTILPRNHNQGINDTRACMPTCSPPLSQYLYVGKSSYFYRETKCFQLQDVEIGGTTPVHTEDNPLTQSQHPSSLGFQGGCAVVNTTTARTVKQTAKFSAYLQCRYMAKKMGKNTKLS